MLLPVLGHCLALVEIHGFLIEFGGRDHVDNLPDVGMAAFDECVDNCRRQLQAFSVSNSHNTRSHLVDSGTSEGQIVGNVVEWLHLRQLPVVANEDHGNLRLLADSCERTDTTTVTRRHAVDFIHDENELLP